MCSSTAHVPLVNGCRPLSLCPVSVQVTSTEQCGMRRPVPLTIAQLLFSPLELPSMGTIRKHISVDPKISKPRKQSASLRHFITYL